MESKKKHSKLSSDDESSEISEMSESIEEERSVSESSDSYSDSEEIELKEIVNFKSSINFEDIESDNYDLWVLTAPNDFDPKEIDGKEIKLSNDRKNAIKTKRGKYMFIEGSKIEAESYLDVWPSKKAKRLLLGKPIKKAINIVEVIDETD